MYKEPNKARQFLEDLVEKNLQCKITREPERSTISRGGMNQIQASLAIGAKITTLTCMLEALELQRPAKVNQVFASMCNRCSAADHVLEECPS